MAEKKEKKKLSLADAMTQINKHYGPATIFLGNENVSLAAQTVPSGCLALDVALKVGGFPLGRIVELSGKEASGKSLTSLMIISEFQKNGKKCAFIDGEQTISADFARCQNVNWNDLIITQPENLEQALEVVELLVSTGEVSLIVFDSVPSLPTLTEESSTAGEVKVASISKVLTPALRKFTPLCAKHNCSIIFINQLRDKIGGFSRPGAPPPEDSPGGRSLKHNSSVRLRCSRGGETITNKQGEAIGHTIKIKVLKNKLSTAQGVEALFTVYYAVGIDKVKDALDASIEAGVVERPNNVMYVYGDLKVKGRDAFMEAIKSNKDLLEKLIEETRTKLMSDVKIIPLSDSVESDVDDDDEADTDDDDSLEVDYN